MSDLEGILTLGFSPAIEISINARPEHVHINSVGIVYFFGFTKELNMLFNEIE